MLPELVEWSSSYALDRAMVREDLVGSAAHVTMLGRTGLIPEADARALRDALLAMAGDTKLALPGDEEDVHMAVEAELAKRLGAVAARLHTARSRNDQVALDLRMHVREEARLALAETAELARSLVATAAAEQGTLLPAYTHRQRAQPVSAAFLVASWASALVRAGETLAFALDRADEMPLGSGACSGTSLPIDRDLVRRLLGFSRLTRNALETVGDRGFVLDYTWGAARVVLALGKIAADLVDFSMSEIALVRLDGRIAAGSSMMPQKKNPDVFELVRGKSARAVGNVVHMLTLVKGLPSGYNRDQQEDRQALLETSPLLRGALRAMSLSMPHVSFDGARGAAALADGSTQATDLAEALVRRGVAFREAYKAVGELVRVAREDGVPLRAIDEARARRVHPALDAAALAALDPASAVAAKEVPGATGPRAVAAQLADIDAACGALAAAAARYPALDALAAGIGREPIVV
jgi:argininosuccinate lyase